MKAFILERIREEEDVTKLEQVVHILEDAPMSKSSVDDFFNEAVVRYGDVLKKLAE